MKKNLLLLKGGGSQEHDVSIESAKYLKSLIDPEFYAIHEVEINKDNHWVRCDDQHLVELNFKRELTSITDGKKTIIDVCIPCIHGFPGETGHLQAFFELIQLPFIGCEYEASSLCFNKVSTKLWLEKLSIPTTPFMVINDSSQPTLDKIEEFFRQNGAIFVKASNQGSSIGCFPLDSLSELKDTVDKALSLSDFALVEKKLEPRELEVSVYETDAIINVTAPSEILTPGHFYSYEQKYSKASKSQTLIRATLTPQQELLIKELALKAFKGLNLRHFARIDFFLAEGELLLNEINTFPGMTSISMFPKMIEAHGQSFKEILNKQLLSLLD